MQLFLALIVSLAVLGTISADPGSCTLQLQETAVQNIFAGVDALVDASVRGLHAYANQAKLFHSSSTCTCHVCKISRRFTQTSLGIIPRKFRIFLRV